LQKESSKHTTHYCIIFLAVCAAFAFLGAFITYYHKYENDDPELSYSYCQAQPECIQTPEEYARVFSSTARNGFTGPACTVSNILGRVVAFGPNTNNSWNPTTLGVVGKGSRISFGIDQSTLEKLLVIGDEDATQIVRNLGYGDDFTCGTPQNNYQDCQYRLILWTAPCPKNRPPLTQGYWSNLEWFYQTYVYGSDTPDLTDAITGIDDVGGLLQNLTGCNETLTPNNYWVTAAQQSAGCSQEFIDAMTYFAQGLCTDRYTPTYHDGAGCVAENRFLNLTKPTAIQLRAYLMQNEGFNPYYTGYGYTANADFYQPLQKEFWYPNDYISDLDQNLIVNFYNGSAMNKQKKHL